jgi:hypothetical protein
MKSSEGFPTGGDLEKYESSPNRKVNLIEDGLNEENEKLKMSEDKFNSLKLKQSNELFVISRKWSEKLHSAIEMIEESKEWMTELASPLSEEAMREIKLQEVQKTLREMSEHPEDFHPAYAILDERKTHLLSEDRNSEELALFNTWHESVDE